jgi:Zn-dependent peptidase ImmA (M78 family)/DNA-binding XRE family transcriptional regulator
VSRETANWVGERLRQRRQAAGMTQAQLAAAVGHKQAAVSLWENGKRLPGLDELIDLADALEISTIELIPPKRLKSKTSGQLRAFLSETDAPMVFNALNRFADRLDTLDPLQDQLSVPADRPIRAAQQLLSQGQLHGVSATRWVDVVRLAQLCGVHVIKQKFPDQLAGLLAHQGDVVAIGVSVGNQNEARQRFTIAHELGHHLLNHHDAFHVDLGPNLESGDAPTFDWRLEREANDFAANLLMPSGSVRDLLQQGFTRERMAEALGVNPLAMRYRMEALGLLPQ